MTESERAERAGRLCLPSARKQRLFLCAVCRRILHLTSDGRCLAAVEVAERAADGLGTEDEVQAAVAETRAASSEAMMEMTAAASAAGLGVAAWVEQVASAGVSSPELAASSAALVCQLPLCSSEDAEQAHTLTLLVLVNATEAMRFGELRSEPDEWQAQEQIFRDLADAQPILDPVWLTPTVAALARQMYSSRDFTPMPILADAL